MTGRCSTEDAWTANFTSQDGSLKCRLRIDRRVEAEVRTYHHFTSVVLSTPVSESRLLECLECQDVDYRTRQSLDDFFCKCQQYPISMLAGQVISQLTRRSTAGAVTCSSVSQEQKVPSWMIPAMKQRKCIHGILRVICTPYLTTKPWIDLRDGGFLVSCNGSIWTD